MRSVRLDDKFEAAYSDARFGVHKHTAEGSFEGIDAGNSNPTQMNVVRRPDQHDTRDRLSALPKVANAAAATRPE